MQGFVEAYRLHYLPHYAYTAFQALEALPSPIYQRVAANRCDVAVAAAGPTPEVIAIAERCAMAGLAGGSITLHAFDIASSLWEPAATQSIALARRLLPNLRFDFQYHHLDIGRQVSEPFSEFDLVTFQHCTNELASGGELAPGFVGLLNSVRTDGTLVFSDLTQYTRTISTIRRLERVLSEAGWRPASRFDETHEERSPFIWLPTETVHGIYEFARVDGVGPYRPRRRWPRRDLKYSWSAWHRGT
jgi:hypothetical protein